MKFHRHVYSSYITSVLLTIGVIVLSGVLTSHAMAASSCKPLLVLIEGGGGGKAGGAMQQLADYFKKTYSGDVQIKESLIKSPQ